jgi:hypothetical protein
MNKARQESFWRLSQRKSALGALLVTLVASSALAGCNDDEAVDTTGQAGTAGTGFGGTSTAGKGGTGGTTAGAGGSKAGSGGAGTGGTAAGAGGSSGAGAGGKAGAGAGGAGAGGAGAGGKAGAGAGGAGAGGAGGAGAGGAGAGGAGAGGAGAGGAGAGGAQGGAGQGGAGEGGGGAGGASLCGDATGDGTLATSKLVATGGAEFVSPFDATPSPDGCSVYFTAIAADGTGAVFSALADGTGLKRLDTPGTLVSPLSITVSTDGATLFVADPGYASDAASGDITKDAGAILTLASGGGAVTVLAEGGAPRSVSIVNEGGTDQLYYGASSATGASIYKIAAAGGSGAEVVATGEPGGIDSADGTTLYAVASTATGGTLLKITGGTATALVTGLHVGLSAGVAVASDGSAVVISGTDPTDGTDVVIRVLLSDNSVSNQKPVTALVSEASGLHKAHKAEVYGFVDGLGTTGGGSVWLLQK